jgi:glycosyltransferase involved in cell wall biosynthesis
MANKKKIAVIASRFPYPLNKGDKLRLFHQIKYLSHYFEIHLYAINEENISLAEQKVVREFCTSVTNYKLNIFQKTIGVGRSILKNEPIQVGYFYSSAIEKKIKISLKKNFIDLVYCQLSRTAAYGLTFDGPVVFDYQDCFSKNYERAHSYASGLKKWFYKREWKSMQRFEEKIHHNFVAKTIISKFDKNSLPFDAESIKVVPNGVDPKFYAPRLVEKKWDVLFSGNLNYQPNADAALLIIKKIYPLLKEKNKNIQIGIAGNTSNQKIIQAANENIHIITHVKDMRNEYAKTKIYIAPLFTGAGLQNKLLEAMSMGIPCLATPITNLSLQAAPDKEILIADSIEDFSQWILTLLSQKAILEKIAKKGQKFVHQNYSWESANEKLRQLLESYL